MNRARKAAALNRVAWEVMCRHNYVRTNKIDPIYFVDYGLLKDDVERTTTYEGNGVVLLVPDKHSPLERYLELTKEQEVKAKLCWLADPRYAHTPWAGIDLRPDVLEEREDDSIQESN